MAENVTPTQSEHSQPQTERGWKALKEHIIENKIQVGLWTTRVFTMLFTLSYLLSLSTFGNPYNAYYKALMSNAATYALRLHQRVPRVQLSREFLALLLLEDSCHYLFYSLIFLYVAPVTLVLSPVFLFALLHSASYSLTLLDCLGQNSCWAARLLISLVEFQSRNILRLCGLCEIMILPLTVFLVLTGRAGLFTPFIYYQFLSLRLSSRRNPFTRNVFHEIRMALSSVASSPSVPYLLRRLVEGLLMLTQRMATVNQ
ncbi:Krueppel homolog 2 [Cephus cinctus]|uniref:Krueppel homolog 2 n=1 Tax=Cephus cinctus TaxID=211228 RepID=A0AAJ7RPD7_CEPCN|nr:Krueppel homolog 2 [Cephus cinctus]